MKYNLVCRIENEPMIRELLAVNGISLSESSRYVLCEEGVRCDYEYDVLICFKVENAVKLLEFLKGGHKDRPQSVTALGGDGAFLIIALHDTIFFNACGNDTFANITGGVQYRVRYKLYELEEILPESFIRINKSEIVNIRHIEKIIPMFKGKLILQMHGYKIPLDISRNYISEFKERIGL